MLRIRDRIHVCGARRLHVVRELLERELHVAQRQHWCAFEGYADGDLLMMAAFNGHTEVVALLLARGSDVDSASHFARYLSSPDAPHDTALELAADQGHVDCVRLLCDAGAAIDGMAPSHCTPLMRAVQSTSSSRDALDVVKLVCSYGASRALRCSLGHTAEEYASRAAGDAFSTPLQREMSAWLQRTRDWTPLHHIEQLTIERAKALLRAGAALHSGSPSPLERATEVGGAVGELVKTAAEPWTPRRHELFPAAMREWVVATMRVAHRLRSRFNGEEQSFIDCWVDHVLRFAVTRE